MYILFLHHTDFHWLHIRTLQSYPNLPLCVFTVMFGAYLPIILLANLLSQIQDQNISG